MTLKITKLDLCWGLAYKGNALYPTLPNLPLKIIVLCYGTCQFISFHSHDGFQLIYEPSSEHPTKGLRSATWPMAVSLPIWLSLPLPWDVRQSPLSGASIHKLILVPAVAFSVGKTTCSGELSLTECKVNGQRLACDQKEDPGIIKKPAIWDSAQVKWTAT